MSIAPGTHVTIGGMEYALDEGYIVETGRRAYSHGGRSIFAEKFDTPGYAPGRNLRQDRLLWYIDRFSGEGQTVIDGSDPDSFTRFYRSEGLDFRTAGEARLNKSIVAQTLTVTAAGSVTDEGSTFTDITGTSTSSGTDRRLNVVGDKIASPTNFAPGATNSVATFHLYREAFSDYATTVEGNAFVASSGSPTDTGTDKKLPRGSSVRTANLTVTAGVTTRVEFFLYRTAGVLSPQGADFFLRIYDKDSGDTVVSSQPRNLTATAAPTAANYSLAFVPASGRTYRVEVSSNLRGIAGDIFLFIDKILYGADYAESSAVIEVYNQTGGATVATKTVTVTSTATTAVGAITWAAAAATNYRFRVKWNAGKQRIWVDKVVFLARANAVYTIDAIEFGAGGKVWLAAHTGADNSKLFVYNFTTHEWDNTVTLNDVTTTTNIRINGMAHSDSREYVALNNSEVYTGTTAGVDDRYAYFSAGARSLRGIAVVQNRLALLGEDSSGAIIYSVPLDDTSTNPWDLATSTAVQSDTLTVGDKTPDGALRNRMCSSPTGARFFINFSDNTAKVYESDLSGSTIQTKELADLGHGAKATSIAYESGVTFITGIYYGNAGTAGSATDVDKLARPALWVIDQNGVIQRQGFFRFDDPAAGPPIDMEPFQQDLYVLQSGIDKNGTSRGYIWRYSLVTGGLYCEYELPVTTPSDHRAIVAISGYVFAAYEGEVFTSGTVGTYRQSAAAGGSSLTTSIYDFDLPAVNKSLTQVTVSTDTMPSNTSVQLEYQIDQDGTWTSLGTATSGKRTSFPVTDVTFNTIQVRATLRTSDGVSTPKLRAIVVEAAAAEEDEYFDLVLRCEDDDSYDHPAATHRSGNERAQNLISLWRSGTPTTFVDGYASKNPGESDTYLVRVGDFRDERNALGEGRVVCTLKVVR